MANADPTKGAVRWGNGMNGAQQAIKDGVQRVTESPMAKAAQNLDKAARNYQQAVSSGRMAAKLNATPLATRQQSMVTTGIERIASGVRKGQQKYQDFATKFYPVMNQASQQVAQMPNNSLADAAAKCMVVWQAAKAFAGK